MWVYLDKSVDKIPQTTWFASYGVPQWGQMVLKEYHRNMKVIFLSLKEMRCEDVKTGTALKRRRFGVVPPPQTFEIIFNEYQIFTRGRDCHQPPVT